MSHGGLGHEIGAGHAEVHGGLGLLEQVAHHLGLGLTLGYALLSCVGVVFEVLLLRSFHADFLTYAEPEDFLMAGLRHPVVLAFVVLSVLILAIAMGVVRLGRRLSGLYDRWRSRSDARPGMRFIRPAAAVLVVGYYFFIFTRFYASYGLVGGICG